MIKALKTVGIVLALVVAVVGGMKIVGKLCCKQTCEVSTECCQHTGCGSCEPEETCEQVAE